MNLEELRTEFLARGFDYLTAAEANNYLNDAYLLDICEEEDWPFLEEIKEGKAPLEISDLRAVEYVIDVTQEEKLDPLQRGRITDDWNVNLAQSGNPSLYYIAGGKMLNVFPVSSTDTISVRYWKVPPRLTGTAVPVLPERWHTLIIDGAVARAFRKTSDWELSTAAKQTFGEELMRMRDSLGMLQHDAPDDYVVVEDPGALF